MPSNRLLPVAAVALLAGVLEAARMSAPRLLLAYDLASTDLFGVLFPALSLLTVLVSPFAAAAVGYRWGTAADVRSGWTSFLGVAFAAAYVGFAATHLVAAALLAVGANHQPPLELVGQLALQLAFGVGLVDVALAGLAGGAIGSFRTAKTGESNTVPA